jgi:DNA-binding GntR family transcriptional regulator
MYEMSGSGATFASPAAVGARSLRQQIAATLQRAITSGAYRPGQRLEERQLGEQFGVSSIPVREALQDLENLGLVANKPNVGRPVVELTPDEAASIGELRRLLEPKLMEWAAARIRPGQVQAPHAQVARMAAAAEAGDVAEFFHQDLLFHKMLWSVSGNRFAARAMETVLGSLFAAGFMRGAAALLREMAAGCERYAGRPAAPSQ